MSFLLADDQKFEAQEWPFQPGPRTVRMHVAQPSAGIDANTGLMLVLHNWGGRYNELHYLLWCRHFADRFNVIGISVNYLQSGGGEPVVVGEKPYDSGYLQAIDCLRALYYIQRQLDAAGVVFNRRRCYTMGGSGGGNVSLMANKFAPHTFSCVVDICGMPGLPDAIAFGDETVTNLNAGYSRDPDSAVYLSPDMQQIRDPGEPRHLPIQYAANPANKVVIVHGLDDASCPALGKIEIYRHMVQAGFRPDAHFLTRWLVDGDAVTSTAHTVGARDKVTCRFADDYLLEEGRLAAQAPGPTDFERAHTIDFPTTNGCYRVDYAGPPTIEFIAQQAKG